MNILELNRIVKNYHEISGETQAIADVSLALRDGEILSLVGPSGCGKSTLLSIIGGLVKPSSGSVLLARPVKLGYMPQRDHLFEWRDIFSNACLGVEIQKRKHKTPKTVHQENIKFIKDMLIQYGLGDFLHHYPSQLSGGMRQRAALIRTLAVKPDILLLDEPFSALDYQTRLYVADEITAIIRQQKKTVVFVTHDISEAIAVSDRVIVLSGRPARVSAEHEIELTP
ncbi:MAG: ABC transporter ATP-binding protein, partial [Clostridiales bacterium]|nr:ABC transporter ATP-binding protein [Clostridiales bacterium]